MAAVVTGVNGQIKWHYHEAAAVQGYTVSRTPEKCWTLRATVVEPDEFKLAQSPLVFVAPHKDGEWRWPIVRLEVSGNTVSASLGQPLM